MGTITVHPVEMFLTTRHLFDNGGYYYPSRWDGDTFTWCDLGLTPDDIKRAQILTITRAEMDAWKAEAEAWARARGNGEMGYPENGNWIDYDWEPFKETEHYGS